MRLLAFILPLLLLVLAVPGEASEIKIGVAGPITGGLAAFGEQIQHGAQIAIDEINQQGGLLGEKLVLVSEDDQCDPKQAHIAATKLVGEKVAVVFGHWCSASSMAASSVYAEDDIVQIDVGSLLMKFTQQGFQNLFRVSTSSKTFAEVIGHYTTTHNPKANIAIVTDQPAVTQELTEELKSFFAKTDNKIVAVEQIRGGEKDFSAVIDKLKTSKAEVIICSCYTIEAGLLARQMADKNYSTYYYGWDTFNSPDFLAIIAGAKTDKIVSIDYARPSASPMLQHLVAELQKRQWPAETTTFLTYASVQIFANAVKEAHSLETSKVAKALHDSTANTLLGPVGFDAYGERKNPLFATYQWVGGKLQMTGILPN